MKRSELRKLVILVTYYTFLFLPAFLIERESDRVKKDKEEGKKESKVRVQRLSFEIALSFLLLFVLPRLWAVYDLRQEENEPLVKQKRKWEEVFPAPIKELVPNLESKMEEKGWQKFSWWDNATLKNVDIVTLFHERKVILGRRALLKYLFDKKLVKEQALWELSHISLEIPFSNLIETDQAEAKEKVKEIENLLREIDYNSPDSLRKQAKEFSQITNKEQFKSWSRDFTNKLAVFQLIMEIYYSIRERIDRNEDYLYNQDYKNIIISSVFQ